MFIRSWVTILLVTLGFSGFAQELPGWVYNASTSSEKLEAVGSGPSLSVAKRAAVAEIIAQVSQSVSAESLSVLEKHQTQTSQRFKQSVSTQTLAIDINDVLIEQQFLDQTSETFYVKASISKVKLVRFLEDELTPLNELRFPEESSSANQVLWSLKYKVSNEYGLRIERALDALGAGKPNSKKRLLDNLSAVANVWQNYGVRVITDSSLQSLTGVITEHIPTATKTTLWLQLKPSVKTRQQQNSYQHKLDLSVELTQPRSPFKVYRQKNISVIGSGDSESQAREDALQQLHTILDTPIQNWFFEKGSEL